MNDKCKYCDYVSKCSRKCEYDSILCRIQRSFPKVVDKSYEQLQQENKLLKENRDKTIEHINKQIYYLEQQKRMLLNSGKITPQNGGIIAELKYKIKEYQDLLDILGGSK